MLRSDMTSLYQPPGFDIEQQASKTWSSLRPRYGGREERWTRGLTSFFTFQAATTRSVSTGSLASTPVASCTWMGHGQPCLQTDEVWHSKNYTVPHDPPSLCPHMAAPTTEAMYALIAPLELWIITHFRWHTHTSGEWEHPVKQEASGEYRNWVPKATSKASPWGCPSSTPSLPHQVFS